VKTYLGGIVETYPAHFFFSVMSWFLTRLLPVLAFFLFAGSALINAAPQGLAEGHLKIISPKEVELARNAIENDSEELYRLSTCHLQP
jgi:hypothetical protein